MATYDKIDAARVHLESALEILDGEGRSAPAYLVELALEHLKPGEDEEKNEQAGNGAHPKPDSVGAARAG